MKLNDNSEAKKVLSELYTDMNNAENVDTDGYCKELILSTYNLLDENYSLTHLFGKLKEDKKVLKALDGMGSGEDYMQKIDWMSHNPGFTVE
ncbi:hypothetical protein FC72_GL001191 [Companilactobacillus tucceti DSM 20183]|uniref:Bacteriocin immunity protein n=1 Tax=Companilactobacillus tucceti DSM 20183 TaxID=1423811 RepID=A0A0R1IXB1_9LACO|nr:hypothetical protein [Companilactobacillus tucceti]KRK63718.1 hypothetical protein FC72_GL001191 [Companilactobacillus tucceti DSM 20183]